MIAHLSGKFLKVGATFAIVDAGGVGYKIFLPISTLASLPAEGQNVSFHIYTSIREDSIELYGFRTELEQQVFELLISVSGVGPKMALAALSSISVRELASAARDEGSRLQTVPGIGKKTAQRIALEVGEQLQEIALAAAADESAPPDVLGDVVEGLVALGYSRSDARKYAREAHKKIKDEQNPAVLIREALGLLNQ